MKVYNKEKTKILKEYDLAKGKLVDDEIEIIIPEVKEIQEEFHYETIKTFANGGKTVKKVIDVKGIAPEKERVEIEKVKVYIPYTQEELSNIHKSSLRTIRKSIFLPAFDKWEKAYLAGREQENDKIYKWFTMLKDLNEQAFSNENIPDRIKYYL